MLNLSDIQAMRKIAKDYLCRDYLQVRRVSNILSDTEGGFPNLAALPEPAGLGRFEKLKEPREFVGADKRVTLITHRVLAPVTFQVYPGDEIYCNGSIGKVVWTNVFDAGQGANLEPITSLSNVIIQEIYITAIVAEVPI